MEQWPPGSDKAKGRAQGIIGGESAERGQVKSTSYFREQVMRKRPYLKEEWIMEALRNPLARIQQADGRVRYWSAPKELGGRALRVVTLEDGETVHNAFPDRDFKRP